MLSIGLTPVKSKTIGPLVIPAEYFRDFLRGCIDGDGSIGSFMHPESKVPQIKLRLSSASLAFLAWIQATSKIYFKISGGSIYTQENKGVHTLTYGKKNALIMLRIMYYAKSIPALERKRRIVERFLKEEG